MAAGKKKVGLYRALGVAILAIFAVLNSLSTVGKSGNESSRFATVQAVAEQNTFAIERTVFRDTVDRIDNKRLDGHVYSDKPPFIAFAVGTALKPVLAVTKWNFRDDRAKIVYLVDLCFGGGMNILIFWWLFNMFRRVRRGSVEAKFLLALGSVMGSWLLSYSVVLNNHTPAALCVLGAYVALWKFSRRPTYRAAAFAAAACGFLGAMEIPGGAIFGLALVPALALASPKERRVEYVLTGVCVVAFSALCVFTLNYIAYRRPLPLYLGRGGSFQPGIHDKSYLGYAAECLFTYRGVFSYQPFLLLAFPALWFCRKRLRAVERIMLAATLLFTVFYLVMTNEYGGAAYGFRYLIPAIPVWSFAAGRFVLEIPKRGARIAVGALAALLLLWGVVTSTVGAYFPFCYAYEGHHAPPGHFSRTVRSTFGGNLLCWSYEHYPESALTKALVRHYGERPALEHLFWSFDNMRRLEGIREFYAARGIRDFNRYYLFRMTDGELRLWIRFARERGGVEKASKP